MNNKSRVAVISVIFLAAVLLRVMGIGYGLPDLSHPDETRVILDTLSMGHRMSLLPDRPDYALLYRYFLLSLFGLYFAIGKLLGIFKNSFDFALSFMINPANIYLIARAVSVLFGTLIGAAGYLIGKRIFKKEEIGIIAMLFCLFEFQLLQHSQWAIYPIIFCFFTLPAFYAMFRLINSPDTKGFVLAGVFTGLAISIQNQGVYLLPALALSVVLGYFNNRQTLNLKRFWVNAGFLALCLSVLALLGNFYWFFIFQKSMLKTQELMGVTRVGFSSSAPYSYNFFSMLAWFVKEILRQDMLLGVFLILGLAYSIYKHKPHDIIFLSFIVTYLWVMSSWGFRILHDMISLLPIMCIFAARFLVEAGERFIRKKQLLAIFSFLIVLPLINDAWQVNLKKLNKDTRQIAAQWLKENSAENDLIAVDWPIFSIPLKSDMPFLFRNPIASKYYNSKIPARLREAYSDYIKGESPRSIYEIIYSTDEPLWPQEMPAAVREKAKLKEVYRDLYSRFHFRTIDDIMDNHVDYIVLTSYSWGFFLLDDDPDKTGLFNAFIKDRPKKNYHHVDYYVDDNRHGIIYYMVKKGREFYQPLLDNQIPNIRLLKEFSPGDKQLGPIIRIYKVGY